MTGQRSEDATDTERVHGFGLDPDCGPCERCLETEEREDEAWYAAREASERREAAKAWGGASGELVAIRADQWLVLRSWWRSPASQPARRHMRGEVVSAVDSIVMAPKPLEQIGRGQNSPGEESVWLWAGVDLRHGEPIYRTEGGHG